jgi:cytochrome c-type biogenesis protein
MRFGGVPLVAVGAMQATGRWGQLIARLQTLITGFQLPLWTLRHLTGAGTSRPK